MRRIAWLGLALFVLAGCYGDIDPCTFDKSVPACDVSRSKAQATIGAIDADAALRATQSAIYLADQGTKSAISVKATKQVVQAEATQSAMNTEATRQAIAAAAAQSVVIYRSTQTSVDAEATKIAVNVGGAIERANAERAAVPYNAVFNVVVFWFLIPALLVTGVIVYGRRTVKRATEAVTQSMMKNAAKVIYGPQNDPKIGFLTFNQGTGQPALFITADGMIGNFADLLNGDTELDRLKVPDELKLMALVEASKRREARGIAAATGKTPWEQLSSSFYEEQQALQLPPAGYQISVVSSTLEPMPQWLDEVDRRLLEAGHD
jgi:hypothetical protein